MKLAKALFTLIGKQINEKLQPTIIFLDIISV